MLKCLKWIAEGTVGYVSAGSVLKGIGSEIENTEMVSEIIESKLNNVDFKERKW